MADKLGSSSDFDTYDSIADAVAGTASGGLAGAALWGISRAIRCEAAGTLMVKQAHGGATKKLVFKAGERQDVAAIDVVASGSSGCAPITIYR